MGYWSKAHTLLLAATGSLSPRARWTTGLSLTIVAVGVMWLFKSQASNSQAYLLDGHRFTTEEIESAQAAFGVAGLNDYEIQGTQIRVPRSLKGKYMAALADGEAMPAQFGSLLSDATTKHGPFASRPQIDAIQKIALERTLADTIRWMRGIEKAAVLYHLPKKTGFRSEGQASAMVTVVPRGNRPLDEVQVPKIRDLVAAAIGIEAEAVTVVDANGRSYAKNKSLPAAVEPLDDPYFARKKAYEAYYEEKTRKALRDDIAAVRGRRIGFAGERRGDLVCAQESRRLDRSAGRLLRTALAQGASRCTRSIAGDTR
jgi:flagellar M-ring protein FliF